MRNNGYVHKIYNKLHFQIKSKMVRYLDFTIILQTLNYKAQC